VPNLYRSVRKYLSPLRGAYTKARAVDHSQYLKDMKGVVHVGANSGQEGQQYSNFGLNVLWVEPIPEMFDLLTENISGFSKQRAVKALVSDFDDQSCEFHIADNGGESSSILRMDEHRNLWPETKQTRTITLQTVTLPTLFSRFGIDSTSYDALVLDTQGAELMILRGAESMLSQFRTIEAEAANFNAYSGCPMRSDLVDFLTDRGFQLFNEVPFGGRRATTKQSYFQLYFQRQ
jgi:FkbM family methyltransferase